MTKMMSKKNNRDEFPAQIKRTLAKRVNYFCSNPECHKPTSGPHTDSQKATVVGEAAHITAASPGGARYDQSMTATQRKSADNGIWLCSNCADLVDKDEQKYPVELLRRWKEETEAHMSKAICALPSNDSFPTNIERYLQKISGQIFSSSLSSSGEIPNTEYAHIIPMLDVPPLVEILIQRENVVPKLYQTTQQKILTAIHGDYGCGKTQLAVLLCKKYCSIIGWISLREAGNDLEKCVNIFDSTLFSLADSKSLSE